MTATATRATARAATRPVGVHRTASGSKSCVPSQTARRRPRVRAPAAMRRRRWNAGRHARRVRYRAISSASA